MSSEDGGTAALFIQADGCRSLTVPQRGGGRVPSLSRPVSRV